MKKLNLILFSIAILLGVTSCKKDGVEVQTIKEYPITLRVNNDSKATIVPNDSTASVKFEVGDHIYLAYQGYCNNSNVKVLEVSNEKIKFSGSLSVKENQIDSIDNSPLFFYFLGGVWSQTAPEQKAYWTEISLNNTPTYTSVCVSLQNVKEWNIIDHTPVMCFGSSNQAFSTDNQVYTTTMKNKCSLVKYSLEQNAKGEEIPNDARVYIQGLNNVVEVDFKVAHKYYNKGDSISELYPGCDKDGFRFVKRKGNIQSGCSPTGKSMTITNIIIPQRDENGVCHSILLPQTNVGKGKGNELFGYYFPKDENGDYIKDENGKCVPTYLKVDFRYDNVVENMYYECTIKVDEDQDAANHPSIIDYPYDA
ncbi:MAG: hypothetical protein ACI358_07720 [Candidatus Limimorpha sp.]